MFYLRDFPDQTIFSKLEKDYPQLDPAAVSGFLRLLVTGSEFLDQLDTLLATYHITHGRWIVLLLLWRKEARQALPSELASEQGVTRATMSGLLRHLEKDQLIQRQDDPADGRKASVVLTASGVDLVERIMPDYYQMVNRLMSPLNSDDHENLVVILNKLLAPTT